MVRTPASLAAVHALPFNLQPGETEALALALNRLALAVGIRVLAGPPRGFGHDYTGTLGVLLRAKAEGKLAALSPALALMRQRTTFWLSEEVYRAALAQAGEAGSGA